LALLGGHPAVAPGQAQRWPVLTSADSAAVQGVLNRGVLSGRCAPEMRALEEEFAQYIGVGHCLATNSGTGALCMALGSAGVGPGDEVIVPALTYAATAQAVLQCGGIPIFVDIDPSTYNIDPLRLAEKIGSRTRAIIPVHLHGLPAEMQTINEIAENHGGLAVIEDAAQAHGATYTGRPVGSLGEMAAFSLNATKNLPAGEGGLFVTNAFEVAQRAARIRFNGLDPDPGWDPMRPLDQLRDSLATTRGSMLLPGEMTAALARSQLRRLSATTERAVRNGRHLNARLRELTGLIVPTVPQDRTHVFHKYRLALDADALASRKRGVALRDGLLEALRAEGVEVSLWQTSPLPRHPVFEDGEAYPVAQAVLDASFVVGSQSYPLFAQPDAVVDAWANAFEKVWGHREYVGR